MSRQVPPHASPAIQKKASHPVCFLFSSPTPSGLSSSPITWQPFTEENQFYLALDVKPRLGQHYRAREVAFWNKLIPKIRRGRKGKPGKAL